MPANAAGSKKLSSHVLDRLLVSIEAGEFSPGGVLPSERELMRRYEVGRPAVREALQTLANMGLARIRHGGRARLVQVEPRLILEQMNLSVRHLLAADPANREHFREARLMFESAMVRLGAAKATDEDIAVLREALAAQQAAADDPAAFIRCDVAFHVAIARISGNPVFSAVSEALLGWLFELSPRQLRAPAPEELTLAEHAAILEAMAAHDPESAVFALRAHLTRANPLYRG
jgi:GntR family transcriptional regulator, sialic acid-inducible nan operon repressor